VSTLYLIRHGQASFGQPDYDLLSPLGERQVGLLRDHLHGVAEAPDALYSGMLRRQRDTARILAGPGGAPVLELQGLNEYSAGSLMRAHATATGEVLPEPDSGARIDPRAFQRRLAEVGLLWAEGRLEAPGVEPWRGFSDRVAAAVADVMAREGRSRRVVVSTSAGVIGAAVGRLLGLPPRESIKLSWSVHNSSVTRIRWDGQRTSLLSFNAVPHLEHPERRTMVTYL
jgi:broad specificity phosphatase PhoE